MVTVESEWGKIIRRNSPEYMEAYLEGYEQAKKEMLEKLNVMVGYYSTTTTVVEAPDAKA